MGLLALLNERVPAFLYDNGKVNQCIATALHFVGLGTADVTEFNGGELVVAEEGMEPDD